ncbi:protein trichome birefringence-like 19 [Arachis hypogaea]|uniref:protein trichome birefringence-like 19 n=1 Tax=Arachis hypogaea TaxID=3818 RepID=UPI000DED2D14|nr:protein trichome birefringence-like 19 [Arachis hypogaea]
MKFDAKERFSCKNLSGNIFQLPITLLIATVVLFPLMRIIDKPQLFGSIEEETRECNIFLGHWASYHLKEPYYNNETCPHIIDPYNCIKNGRPDREFIKLRWKPYGCELPLFNATEFLRLVQGKSMAFVGDSMGRNQMDSLICLLNSVGRLEDITERYTSKDDIHFRWWFSSNYNFTLTILWAPFLVKATGADLRGSAFDSSLSLYLDEPNDAWVSKVEDFDYVIFSTGQWFYRPLTFYENDHIVGGQQGVSKVQDINLYGYKKVFQTSFRTIINLKRFKGLTFLVTQSAKHFEHGEYNEGGNCNRTRPFTKEERQGYNNGELLEAMHHAQVDEFREAEKEARKKGLHFGLIDISDATSLRPDAHPDKYGLIYNKNVKVVDCVHWCLPGAIDTWNEFLFYKMKQAINKKTSTSI